MVILKIFLTSVLSIVVLFVLTKLVGNKQLSEANMFDYINGITIGSIAAELATSLEKDWLKPLTAMIIYGIVTFLISVASQKSVLMRRFFTGKELILFDDGKIFSKNLKTASIDVNDFLTQCRLQGYFDLQDIQTAIFETNGKISFIPKNTARPVNTGDLNIIPKQEKYLTNLIIDGKILKENLSKSGRDEKWLKNRLKENNVSSVQDVFLATYDGKETLNVYKNVFVSSSTTPFE